MIRLIRSLVDRGRAVGRGKLWAGIALSAVLNVGSIAYLTVTYPVVRLRPICVDWSAFWFLAGVQGEMAGPFFRAYHATIFGLDHHVRGKRIYVMLADWWDMDEVSTRSFRATYDLLEERTGVNRTDLWYQRRGVPEFDEVERQDWPPCSGMRKLAIEGGEWAYSGPTELKPERATGRIVPLPHLTDPLLFEPVRPRSDADTDDATGSGDRTGIQR